MILSDLVFFLVHKRTVHAYAQQIVVRY